MRRRASLWPFLLAFLVAGAASARTVLQIPTEPDAHVHVQVECCFSQMPPSGYAPVDVTINNSSRRPQTWNLQFANYGLSYYSSQYSSQSPELMRHSDSVTVESGAARTFKLLVPLSTSDGGSRLSVGVSGYGLPNEVHEYFPNVTPSGKDLTPCMAVSDGTAAEVGKYLENIAAGNAQQLYKVDFRADELPDDWRAFSGFAGIWLLESEWSVLQPPQRTALEDWVATGGKLYICAKATPTAPQKRGMGAIVSMNLQSLDLGATRLQAILNKDYAAAQVESIDHTAARKLWGEMPRAHTSRISYDDLTHWTAAQDIGDLKPNLPLLISFLGIFATVVGPLNLFFFAGEGRRSRLFWTVPLISLSATAILLVLIIVQDGFGGWGIRNALIYLVPSDRKAVVFQDQISRTGVLGSTAFSLRDPAWMTMVNIEISSPARRAVRTVHNSDIHFSGEWFKSRSLQSQWIESVIPTRAEVTLLNFEEARRGPDAPVIISSIAAPLSEFWFWDSLGRCWRAKDVRTGVKTALSPADEPREKDLLPSARIPLRKRLAAAKGVRGNFVAITTDAPSFIDTLATLRWQNRQAVYAGPVTGANPD